MLDCYIQVRVHLVYASKGVQGKTQECAMDSDTVSKNTSNNINHASNKINITNKQQDTKCKADPLTLKTSVKYP